MTRHIKLFISAALSMLCIGVHSQTLYTELNFDGLFDNREYKNDMLPQTIYGMRFMPKVGFIYENSALIGGFTKIWEFGADDAIDPEIILYYGYKGNKWNAMFGVIPRDELQRQLPDALLYDSIAYFEPTISGTLFQRHGQIFQTELYCNWFSRQTETNREAFRIVWDGYVSYSGKDGQSGQPENDLLHAGWFVTMTHWAKPKEAGHFIYDQFQFNPYIGFNLGQFIGSDWRVKSNVGLLYSMVRCRKDGNWHKPMGFLGDIQVGWKMFDIKTTLYKGGNQQPFLKDSEAGLAFHRSDPFYKDGRYLKTEFKVQLLSQKNVAMGFNWNIHMTSDNQVHHQQMITLKYAIGRIKNL
ncbi:MAG: hypothetical protein IJU24_00175 [Bacteroidaceae bacterium]|nr:hypothetical protein [Bacteroidaceae bacterium]